MAAPVRGTQSFVGVMGEVWRRPSLAALEIAWRWLLSLLCIASVLVLQRTSGIGFFVPRQIGLVVQTFQSMSVFRPAAPLHAMSGGIGELWNTLLPLFLWLGPLFFLLWNLLASFGRTLVLRRLDKQLHPRRLALFLLGTLRALLLSVAWLLWFRLLAYAARTSITLPASHGNEPHLVLFSAMLISGTLVLYVAWGIVSWPLYLAPLLAMRNNVGTVAALRAALGSSRGLRGKLIEINLVMNIVRIALIVLAMVMSASPLAFQSVATQQFFAVWWSLAVLLYFAASDYFHVVRSAAYLSLHRVYNPPPAS